MIKRIFKKLQKYYYTSSSKRYIEHIRSKGVRVGKGTVVLDPNKIQIDVSRPELLEIGENVFLHRGTIILTHDWASWCFVNTHNEFIPSHGKVKIGNNVWLGENVSILKGVTIGDNVIIGLGAVVVVKFHFEAVPIIAVGGNRGEGVVPLRPDRRAAVGLAVNDQRALSVLLILAGL